MGGWLFVGSSLGVSCLILQYFLATSRTGGYGKGDWNFYLALRV